MIVVFGSINIDLVTRAKIPAPGETTLGVDGFAAPALKLLKEAGVDLSATRAVAKPTGAAFIVVDPSGENAIVVASGANAEARAAQLKGLAFGAGDLLLLQRETPEAEVE